MDRGLEAVQALRVLSSTCASRSDIFSSRVRMLQALRDSLTRLDEGLEAVSELKEFTVI